jgi:hypothetical protein
MALPFFNEIVGVVAVETAAGTSPGFPSGVELDEKGTRVRFCSNDGP